MFKDLDPLLHSQVRLAVMSVLMGVKSAEFSFLLECTKTTKGNLSFQLSKLNEAGYIEIRKSFKGKYPLTSCEITDKGAMAFKNYVESITEYINRKKESIIYIQQPVSAPPEQMVESSGVQPLFNLLSFKPH